MKAIAQIALLDAVLLAATALVWSPAPIPQGLVKSGLVGAYYFDPPITLLRMSDGNILEIRRTPLSE